VNKADKEKFVRSLCDSVRDDVLERVSVMPEEWNGIELRAYLAEKFSSESRLIHTQGYRRRLRDYRNVVATHFGL
jgi:hypothetical protein